MTRDEAIKTMAGGWFGPSEVAEKWIDMFVKLGMLDLEDVACNPKMELCHEDDDWNWRLNQTVAFKAAAVKQLRAKPVPGNCNQPKGPREQFIDAMFNHASSVHGLITPRHALDALDNAGLQIVEK